MLSVPRHACDISVKFRRGLECDGRGDRSCSMHFLKIKQMQMQDDSRIRPTNQMGPNFKTCEDPRRPIVTMHGG